MKKLIPTIGLLLIFLSFSLYAGPRDDATAAVTVYKELLPDRVIYTYTLTNRSEYSISGLTIGFDYYHGTPEITGPDPLEIIGPNNWQGRIISLEASNNYEIEWNGMLLPGKSISGFKVVTQSDNSLFTTSNWTVTVNGPPTNASSQLELVAVEADTIPPNVTVTLSPSRIWPPNNKMVLIQATLTALDNRDTNPVIKLESIVCNECDNSNQDIQGASYGTDDRTFSVRASRKGKRKNGRVYTVTYSATDVSGNKGSGSATVTIPHDLRK